MPAHEDAELELALDRFAAFAAHQLGEGVRIVTGWTEALEEEVEGQLPSSAEQALQAIAGGGLRLQRFVDDLLHMTAIARQPPAATELDVCEPLAVALAELELELDSAGALVDVSQACGVVFADRRRLELIFEHLLRGALAARSDTPARIRVVAGEGADWLTLTVHDNGLAVTRAQAEEFFEPLAAPRGRGALLGAGVGPLICRRIIESHGGRIWAQPGDGGRGLTVHATLPTGAERS
jgi:light-regulated signal transduction histidine kinase (bacteriophytochrome)